MTDPINLFWWRGSAVNNFGDELSRIIVERAGNRNVIQSSLEECDLVAIGSVLNRFSQPKILSARDKVLNIWGSGFMRPIPMSTQLDVNILALRGPISGELAAQEQCCFGDPGLLSSRFIDTGTEKKNRWGIVPHFTERKSPFFKDLCDRISDCIIVDVTNPDVETVIRQIASCDLIVSTGLHGLIVADSFGIPNVWAQFGEIDQGRELKFKDYFASVERPIPSKYHLTGNTSEEDLGRFAVCADTSTVTDVCDNLVKAFSGFSN